MDYVFLFMLPTFERAVVVEEAGEFLDEVEVVGPLAVLVTQGQVEGHVDGADQTRGFQQAALQGVGLGAGILERQVA